MSYSCEINLTKALDWQRSNAVRLTRLLEKKQAWYEKNYCDFWNDWQTDVFNLDTANEFGLSVWSIILDEPLFGVNEASPEDYPDWGFSETSENFDNGSFASDSDTGFNFTIEQKRTILKLRAFIFMSMSGSTVQINERLADIIGNGKVVAFDGLNMDMIYLVNDSSISGFIEYIKAKDLLPRPAGVSLSVLDSSIEQFGFAGDSSNFNNGNFETDEL